MAEKTPKRTSSIAATRQADRRGKILVQVGVASVLIALIAGIGISLAVRKSHDAEAGPVPAITARPGNGLTGTITDTGAIRIGRPDAKVTVRIVTDMQCPACRMLESANAGLLAEEVDNGKAAIEYQIVSFLDRASLGSRYSTRAASAAFAVAESDPSKFQGWLAAMYDKQPAEGSTGLTDDQLIAIARDAGYTDPAVAQAITDNKYDGYVQQVTKTLAPDIRATPTVYVNGEQIPMTQQMFAPGGLRQTIETAANS
ncbi:thioredoxin domain-containing protein [Nocardia sp. NPDC051030]|uniref:DsbA family protein n=1 Tax=Nocardia sp. NPDC051030 TaxID=3155162 RepID=UPI0034320763